ncbi:dienelactone hydrolase [Xanthocytophaga agilis]|uniref:Dienelactone hydrolase n=1 Tax=Xanthocytophaga agilis TaxID=3048010 RepID=A0AAE3RAX4_9BACT|nr:dienelactone hydrolase [Xanthocytophaga agilis]MDJ1506916.1 dienelactone hydrolase [Xanthocytophaga agilis]
MFKYSVFAWCMMLWVAASAQTNPAIRIGQRTFRFQDAGRNRPVVTEVWYPTSDTLTADDTQRSPFVRDYTVRNGKLPAEKLPLLMLSHGTGGGRLTLEWLAQVLVKGGFIVAAVDHWGNTYDNKIPVEFVKTWERPLDISFALSALLEDGDFTKVIDPQRIGAIGFSLGGYTVMALAGGRINYPELIQYYKTTGRKEVETPELPGLARFLNDTTLLTAMKHTPGLKDNRIKAIFAIAPALGAGFTQKSQLSSITCPVYIVGMHNDQLAPVLHNARHYHQLIPHSFYYEFSGAAGHYVALAEASNELQTAVPDIFADPATVNRHQIHGKISRLAATFFKRFLNKP